MYLFLNAMTSTHHFRIPQASHDAVLVAALGLAYHPLVSQHNALLWPQLCKRHGTEPKQAGAGAFCVV